MFIPFNSTKYIVEPLSIETLRLDYIGETNTTLEWWNDPERSCTSYEVSVDNGHVLTLPREGNTSKCNLNDLTGGTTYHISIRSVVSGQKSQPFKQEFSTSNISCLLTSI